MLIGRHSFIRQNKLSDVAGRIDYISNPKRQEHLYATYQTEGATPEFWKNLARENQLDFKASGTTGKCIEGREFIIALPESFVEYKADDVVRLFTDSFHKGYDSRRIWSKIWCFKTDSFQLGKWKKSARSSNVD